MPAAVQPDRILKDLARLWVDLGKEDAKDDAAGVLRACAMTLIVAVDKHEDAQDVGETLAELMHEHPSRVILLRVGDERGDTLDSRVFAQCWKPFGRRQQICCEQIEITASPSRLTDLPKLVLGLMVPDLPVVLWSRSPVLAENPEFQHLFSLPDKIIVDSAQFRQPEAGLNYVRGLLRAGRNAADLEWTRLTPLRETIAHLYEMEHALAGLDRIREVEISHTGERAPVSARYLGAWLMGRLPASAKLTFRPAPAGPAYPVRGVRMSGADFAAGIELEGSCALLSVNGMEGRAAFPALNNFLLLREELSILGTDSIFRRCVE
jgi:glucose-6-phosphate dehydrogenase assembly protein OpcA